MTRSPRRRRVASSAHRPNLTVLSVFISVFLALEVYMSLTHPIPLMAYETTMPEVLLDRRTTSLLREHRYPPRIVAWDGSELWRETSYTRVSPLGGSCPYCLKEFDHHLWVFERPFYEECQPMADWQTHFYPSCNNLHEVEVVSSELVSLQGSWRSVWTVPSGEGDGKVVLKMLKFEKREFDHESYAYHTVDARVMERLTSSPYVVDIYGFCGQSVLTEYATGNARMLLKSPRFSNRERLKLAYSLVRALEDLHSVDYPESSNATIGHNDINIANAVDVDGQIKLNDFNLAVLMRWNGTQPCGYPVRFERKMWQAPEECLNTSYVDPAQSDMYSLGNLLFQVLTTRQPWTHLEPNGPLNKTQVFELKKQAAMPFVPEEFLETEDLSLRAVREAMYACYRFDPLDRPTSYELATGLMQAIRWSMNSTLAATISDEALKSLFTRTGPFTGAYSTHALR